MSHVLIIEDEWLIADYLSCLAADAGATSIALAVTEDEAVESALVQMPDIILSDVDLLVGTGPAAVKKILSALGHIPVIFVRANPASCRPCTPPSVVLTKPIDPGLLIETFRQLVLDERIGA